MAAEKLGAKRSLFNKPSWAATSSKAADEEVSIFSQNHLYNDILASEKKRREKAAEKARQRAEKEKEQESERQSKRRRISEEPEDSDGGSDSDAIRTRDRSASSQSSRRSVTPVRRGSRGASQFTPRRQKERLVDKLDPARPPRTRSQRTKPAKDTAILIGDDDDEDEKGTRPADEDDDLYGPPATRKTQSRQKPRPSEPESESEEEDEYLRQLKAEARQKAQMKRLGVGTGKESTPDPAAAHATLLSEPPTGAISASPQDPDSQHTIRATSTPAIDSEDTEVKILIKTIIPGAKDIIVNRRISQPLDKVKEFWIKRFELDPHIAAKVFFTWNNTRLYNSTTMRGIIERLKKTHPVKDGSGGDPSNGQILIEAVTDEIFEYRQKQRARKLAEAENQDADQDSAVDTQAEAGALGDDYNTTASSTVTTDPYPNPPPQKDGIVLKLTARDFEDMMLRVRPNTTVAKILNGFVRMRKIDLTAGDTECWLSYDGERLDPTATVEEVGFEHEDSVDVHVR